MLLGFFLDCINFSVMTIHQSINLMWSPVRVAHQETKSGAWRKVDIESIACTIQHSALVYNDISIQR